MASELHTMIKCSKCNTMIRASRHTVEECLQQQNKQLKEALRESQQCFHDECDNHEETKTYLSQANGLLDDITENYWDLNEDLFYKFMQKVISERKN